MAGIADRNNAPEQRLQRVKGTARISVVHLDGTSRLSRLYQEGSAKIRLPRTHNGSAADVVLINTSGGITGGDRLDWTIDVGKNARCVTTTQACEKIYRACAGTAHVATTLKVHEGAALSWLPQETILFDRSSLSRKLYIELAPNATLLLAEPMILGRRAMGETVREAFFTDRWRIRRGGRLLHAEETRLDGDIPALLDRTTTTAGACAFATVLVVHKDAGDMVEPIRGLLGNNAGASAIQTSAGNRLIVRMVASGGFELRRQLIPVIDWCNRKLTGTRQGLPKLWTI
ncbi:urease accessory protein UreD [Hoeflea poritis]|uniref:Urease accessory protein UreD n=1 Tax=Hoeflea poritis TaxID=2993659 RepID=A0ABT4VRC5_9HYPH|nr:urease accessory protein UreD [Hoeflea poritis]MDA4847257.1 urease accessory protein UreD [Hoeflea poritis]